MFHAIFAAYVEGNIAGIGAITDEPGLTSTPAWRMLRASTVQTKGRSASYRASWPSI
jgi:hypothetical protein